MGPYKPWTGFLEPCTNDLQRTHCVIPSPGSHTIVMHWWVLATPRFSDPAPLPPVLWPTFGWPKAAELWPDTLRPPL